MAGLRERKLYAFEVVRAIPAARSCAVATSARSSRSHACSRARRSAAETHPLPHVLRGGVPQRQHAVVQRAQVRVLAVVLLPGGADVVHLGVADVVGGELGGGELRALPLPRRFTFLL